MIQSFYTLFGFEEVILILEAIILPNGATNDLDKGLNPLHES
jgi:hypothetical protein